MPEYKNHYPTQKAIEAIIKRFNWPWEQWMQDWPLEISDKIELSFSLQEYPKLMDDDEKFLLMQGILFALDELESEDYERYGVKVAAFLKEDFDIHKSTIHYWIDDRNDFNNQFQTSTLMRHIWNSQIKK